jgi:outer membrane protein
MPQHHPGAIAPWRDLWASLSGWANSRETTMRATTAVVAVCLSAAGAALAQEVPAPNLETGEADGAGIRWTLGLGAIAYPDYQGSQDYTAAPLWNLRAQNLYHPDTYAQVFGPVVTSNLVPDEHFRLGPMVQYVPKRGSVDNRRVDDLQNVDPAVMLGAIIGYEFDLGTARSLELDFLGRQDVAEGNGFLGTVQATYRMPLGESWRSSLGLTSTWASSDYMEAYFGIDRRDSARSGLDEYDADEGFKDVGANASLTWLMTPSWSLTGIAAYRRLLGDAEDSPVTEEGSANQWYGGLLFNYHF